jgi:two-component system chemotaxis response regulator CheB
MSRLRVLIADDSAFMRGAIARLLGADDRFEVVGQARDGAEAVQLASELSPHLVTMDFNMPGLNGAEATRRILAAKPVGIVMLSAHTVQGATETVAALAAGAVDFVTKPGGEVSTQLGEVRDELIQKLIAASRARINAAAVEDPLPTSRRPASSRTFPAPPPGLRLVVVAVSTGGPAALERLMAKFPQRDSVAGVIVQHMPIGYTTALAERLDGIAACTVREAKAGDKLKGGVVLVAPGGTHLEVDKLCNVRLTEAPPVHGVRPAADVTLKSAALAFGPRLIGVVMTGMGRDGATGLAAVKSAGGITLAQDAATSTIYGMPKAAVDLGVVDQILPLGELAGAIDRATR